MEFSVYFCKLIYILAAQPSAAPLPPKRQRGVPASSNTDYLPPVQPQSSARDVPSHRRPT